MNLNKGRVASNLTGSHIEAALDRGASRYFAECRQHVPGFTRRHFHYPGAWHSNKVAFGWDLIKMPLNLMWAPCYVLTQIFAYFLQRSISPKIGRYLNAIPGGFTTKVHSKIRDLVASELLQNPFDTEYSRLHQLVSQEIRALIKQDLDTDNAKKIGEMNKAIDLILANSLKQYSITRTASADIANSLFSTVVGAITLKKFTPGGLGLGIILAAFFAKQAAADKFIFGETLGKIYYSMFPPEPSLTLILAGTLTVMCLLAAIAAFSGLITDPLQSLLGIHQRRLNQLINHLENDFNLQANGGFKPKDQYFARILEALDVLKTHI